MKTNDWLTRGISPRRLKMEKKFAVIKAKILLLFRRKR